jgi:serine acetyltransferase
MAPRPSEPDQKTYPTLVRAGATLGAGAIVGCNLSIGRFAMVGMGSMVTRPVDDFHLVVGNPARVVGYVCRCGQPFARFEPNHHPERIVYSCAVCRRRYTTRSGVVNESFAAIK